MLPTSFLSLRRPTDLPAGSQASVTATVIDVYVSERIGCIHIHLTAISIYYVTVMYDELRSGRGCCDTANVCGSIVG